MVIKNRKSVNRRSVKSTSRSKKKTNTRTSARKTKRPAVITISPRSKRKRDTGISYSKRSKYGVTATVDSKKWVIPVTSNGKVEDETLVARLVTYKGESRKRNPHFDLKKRNKIVIPNTGNPKDIVPWWNNPGCCDIEGIDTPDAVQKMYSSEGVKYSSKSMEKAQSKIAILGGKKSDRVKIRKTLDEDFSAAELNRITKDRDVVVIMGSPGSGKSGYHRCRTSDIYLEDICFKPNCDEDTIVHEFVHALRLRDPNRTGLSKTVYEKSGDSFAKDGKASKRDRIREESCTVAEANIRCKEPNTPSGYYSYIPGGRGKEYQNYREDRVTLLGEKKDDRYDTVKGRKGKEAVRILSKRYGKTHISKLGPFD